MSETVWKAEAEAGLVAFVEQYIAIGGKPVGASVRLPDEDLKEERFPCVTVYNLFDAPNVWRREYSRFAPYLVEKDLARGEATLTKQPVPVDAHYQIDFWSQSNRQLNEMTRCWMDKCEGFFNLECRDVSGNVRSIYCAQVGNLRNQSQAQYDRERRVRVFNASVDYRVWLEIFDRETYVARTVSEEGMVIRLRVIEREE